MQVEPDWEIDAFMKASVRHGKRHNIRTDYTLRLLGLEVTALAHMCKAALNPNCGLPSAAAQICLWSTDLTRLQSAEC